MAAEPHVCDGIDLKWMYASDSEEEDDWSRSVYALCIIQQCSATLSVLSKGVVLH